MSPTLETEQLRALIKQELPVLVETDPELQQLILRLSRREFADRLQTEDHFTRILNELQRDREEQNRKWEENQKALREFQEKQDKKWEEQNRKWEEQNRKWEEQNRKWEANQQENKALYQRLHEEVMMVTKRLDRSIGGLGARWGLRSEKAFRNALAGILEENFGVKVIHVNEWDATGSVFGRPDQIELDLIITNGLLLICELKSSVSKGDMYIFERKVRFYEKSKQRQVNRLIVISPMIEGNALEVAKQLGIETFGDSSEVTEI